MPGSPEIATGRRVLSDASCTRAAAPSAERPSNLRQTPSAPTSLHITAHSAGSEARPENIEAASGPQRDASPSTSPKTIGLRRLAPSRSRNGWERAPPAE